MMLAIVAGSYLKGIKKEEEDGIHPYFFKTELLVTPLTNQRILPRAETTLKKRNEKRRRE